MRVIFDLSALHGDMLTQLPQLQRHHEFFHTPVFLNELLQGYGSSKAAGRWPLE